MSIARKEWLCGVVGAFACHGVWAALFLWEKDHPVPSHPMPSSISVVFEESAPHPTHTTPSSLQEEARQKKTHERHMPLKKSASKTMLPSKTLEDFKKGISKKPSDRKALDTSRPLSLHKTPQPRDPILNTPCHVTEAVLSLCDTDVHPLVAPAPLYPEEARRRHEEETILVRVFVNAAGRVTHVALVKGTSRSLIQAALEAVRDWRFPVQRNDQYTVLVPISFSLEGEEKNL